MASGQILPIRVPSAAASETFLDELYSAALTPEHFRTAVTAFGSLFGADCAALYVERGGLLQRSLPEPQIESHDECFREIDQAIAGMVGQGGFTQGALHTTLQLPRGDVFLIAIVTRMPDRKLVALVALRSAAPFSEAEYRCAVPLVSQFERVCALHTAACRADLERTLFKESTIGLVVTRQRQIERANDMARGLLAAGRPVSLVGRQLVFEDARMQGAFDGLSDHKSRHDGHSSPNAALVPGSDGSSWLVQLGRVTPAENVLIADFNAPPIVMVALTPFDATSASRDLSLRGLTDLSVIERSILKALVDGHDVPTVAAAMERSQETVRWHVKRMYTKLGVESQTDLVRFGLLLLPMASLQRNGAVVTAQKAAVKSKSVRV